MNIYLNPTIMYGKVNDNSSIVEGEPFVGDYTKGMMSKDSEDSMREGLSLFGAILAFLSTIVGGGIVGLPFAFYWAGIPFGIFLNILVGLLTAYSCYLYLLMKDLTGGLE
jgi:hypothetical protein